MSYFVLETPPLSPWVSLEETSLLSEALKQRLEDLVKKPSSSSNGNGAIKTGYSSTVETLRAIVPTGLEFASVYQLVQYLNVSLIECFGYETHVRVVPTDDTAVTTSASESSSEYQSIKIRNSGVLVELKLLLKASDTASQTAIDEDLAQRSLCIQEFHSNGREDIFVAATKKRSPRKNYAEGDYDNFSSSSSSDNDDEVLATLSKRYKKKKKKRTHAKRRPPSSNNKDKKILKSPSKKKKKAPPPPKYYDSDDDSDHDNDDDMLEQDDEPMESAGEAMQKKYDQQWQTNLSKLNAYKNQHGNCNVPRRYPLDRSLGLWVKLQKYHYKNNKLKQERIEALEAIGIQWKLRHVIPWDSMFERLQVYHLQYGNTDVPRSYDEHLVKWMDRQRKNYHAGMLRDDKAAMMENLGFSFEEVPDGGAVPNDPTVVGQNGRSASKRNTATWEEMFDRLVAYKEQHGDCLVMENYEKDLKLGGWVHRQRRYKSLKTLSEERIAKLDSIDFVWKITEKWGFDQYLERLKVFHNKYGDCDVPRLYPEDLSLGRWVGGIRAKYKKNQLTDQQVFELDSLGFAWKCPTSKPNVNHDADVPGYWAQRQGSTPNVTTRRDPESWQSQFDKLCAFKAEHGHTCVPKTYLGDLDLARWVTAQRNLYKNSKLEEEKIDKLNSIGFVWKIVRQWYDSFQLLKAYYEQHGNTNVPIDYAEDPKLGRWVNRQRRFREGKELTPERLDLLKEIGFVWNPPGYMAARNPHPPAGMAPQPPTMAVGAVAAAPPTATATAAAPTATATATASPVAKDSVGKIRQDRRDLRFENQELRRKLREAEQKNFWESRFEQLKIYKDLHGDCHVPIRLKLGQWVSYQRDLYKKEAMSQERILRLESLGMAWESLGRGKNHGEANVRRRQNEKMLEEEVRLQEEKVRLLEAKVKLQQEKLKLQLVKESGQTEKSKRKSTSSGGATNPPNTKKTRTS